MLNVKYLLTNLTNYIIYINFEVINPKNLHTHYSKKMPTKCKETGKLIKEKADFRLSAGKMTSILQTINFKTPAVNIKKIRVQFLKSKI